VSLHLLNLDFHSIEGLAQEFALLCRWESHGGGDSRQGSDGLYFVHDFKFKMTKQIRTDV
jgi:hypothetical protein